MTTLHWRKPDDYHIRSECGRFSVARTSVRGELHYIAWNRTPPITEIGVVKLPPTATDAERIEAIKKMQRLCGAAVANDFTHTTQGESHAESRTDARRSRDLDQEPPSDFAQPQQQAGESR